MTIPHDNDNDVPSTETNVLRANDYRLDYALKAYDVPPDASAMQVCEGISMLAQKNKPCVGHLVTMSDNELSWHVGPDIASALRHWQEEIIGIPCGTKIFGWQSPAQAFLGF